MSFRTPAVGRVGGQRRRAAGVGAGRAGLQRHGHEALRARQLEDLDAEGVEAQKAVKLGDESLVHVALRAAPGTGFRA